MPYIGNQPAEAYSSVTKDSFSGDGSTTAFTLSVPSTTNDLRVVVENVIQDPTVAYSVSGTTLTFTSAPPTGTNNIYAVNLGPAVQTVTPPAEIGNATNFTDGITVDKNGGTVITADRASSDGTIIDLQKDGSSVGNFGSLTSGRDLHVNSTGGILTLESNFSSTERQIVFGNTYFGPRSTDNNAVDLGRSVSQFKDLYLSGGVFLGGTGSANLLDDYEEGTWTPAFTYSVSTTGLSITYANQTGYYTRIGNIVHYTCDVRITSFTKGSASGNLQLEGFPFASKNQSNYGRPNTVPNLYQWPYTSTDGFIPMFGMFQDGAAKGDFSLMRPNNTSINLDDPDGDSMLFLTGWYYAT